MLKWFGNLFRWKCHICYLFYYKFRSDKIKMKFSNGDIVEMTICPDCAKVVPNMKVRNLK